MKPIIKIAWLFPHVFCLHGDRGNLLALQFECRRRGYSPEVDIISLSTKNFNPEHYDLMICPPGEIENFESVIAYLKAHRQALDDFIKERPLLVTGTSIGLFTSEIKRDDGSLIEGLNLIQVKCSENPQVYGDDLYYDCSYNKSKMEIVGSQIQMIQLEIGDERPFGILHYGFGNTGKTKQEGVLKEKAIFTNTLGPILVCNPWLTVEIINVVEKHKNLHPCPEERDNELEEKSLKSKIDFILSKKSDLIPIENRID